VATGLVIAQRALAGQEPPTNLDLLKEAVEEAVLAATDKLFETEVPESTTVIVASGAEHKANWLVEDVLLHDLVGRGLRVRRSGKTAALDTASLELSFRIIDISVGYPSQARRWGLGRVWVQREVATNLTFELVDLSSGQVKWIQDAEASRTDWFRHSRLSAVESKAHPFTRASFEKRSWARYLEPVIVSGVIGGLVYIFYSHR